jgi:AcrR family transcriptional regulator
MSKLGVANARTSAGDQAATGAGNARERILRTAYELFAHNGTKSVGVDRIVAEAGVAKMTLYRHFASKDDLVVAFLQRREDLWTHAWLETEVKARASDPREQLLAIFDVFHDWFQHDDFEGCSFINVLLEEPIAGHAVHEASVIHLANIRTLLRELAEAAGVGKNVDDFTRKWHILMKGCIVAAGEGDQLAARRARDIGRLLLAVDVTADRAHPRVGGTSS